MADVVLEITMCLDDLMHSIYAFCKYVGFHCESRLDVNAEGILTDQAVNFKKDCFF